MRIGFIAFCDTLKCVFHILIVCFWALFAISCTPSVQVQEAQRIVAEADSMDTASRLYSDTTALRVAIQTLNTPTGRLCYRNALADAYYFLGRYMEDSCTLPDQAAAYYIACDRLKPSDPIRRGRVNACMAYICSNAGEDSLALIFNERSTEAFRESGDTLYYAYGLLYLSENHSQMRHHAVADSLWRQAQSFHLGSTYSTRVAEVRGTYFQNRQAYDSALVYYMQALDNQREGESRSYTCMKIIQTYEGLHTPEKSYPYAYYIATHSTNPTYISNACYTLIEEAANTNDVEMAAYYAHLREDVSRERGTIRSQYSIAAVQCEEYLTDSDPERVWKIVIYILMVILCTECIVLLVSSFRHRHLVTQKDALLQKQDILIQQQADTLENNLQTLQQMNEALFADHTEDFLIQVRHLRSVYPEPRKEWNDYTTLKHDLQPTFLPLCHALEQKNLQEYEIKFCIYLLLYEDATLSQLAEYIYHSSNGIRTTKGRIANKLGSTAANLRQTLLQMSV